MNTSKIRPVDEIHVMLDRLKNQGFYYSTIAGITVSAYDIQIPQDKYHLFDDADEHLEVIKNLYNKGKLTEHERYTTVIKLWNDVKKKKLLVSLKKSSKLTVITQSSSCQIQVPVVTSLTSLSL